MSTMMGDRVVEAREHAKLSRKELAAACGVSYAAIQMLEVGRIKGSRPHNLAAIAAATGFRMEYLARGELPKLHADSDRAIGEPASQYEAAPRLVWEITGELPAGDYRLLLPLLTIAPSAENGRAAVHIDKTKLTRIHADFMRHLDVSPKHLACITAADDSMAPWLNQGELAVVDRSDTQVRDGERYALRYGDQLRIKLLHRRFDGGLTLRSYQAEKYPDEAINTADLEHIEVIGRIVWRGGSYAPS